MNALSKTFPTPPFLRWLPTTPTPPGRRFSSFLSPDGEAADADRVEELLASPRDVGRLMKMDRRAGGGKSGEESRWFPYCDNFTCGGFSLTSREVVEALEPHILEGRKERMRRAVGRRSYGLCLVVEGLTDFGNVSAAFRSADALGVQSVHVVSCDSSKRCCFFF